MGDIEGRRAIEPLVMTWAADDRASST